MKTLADISRFHRQRRPDKRAMLFTDDDRQWSFEALDIEACQCANALAALGVGNQDRVAYLDKNQPEYFTYLFGGAKLSRLIGAWRQLKWNTSSIIARRRYC